MPSAIKTTNIGLNQWSGNEYPKRLDFVEDNAAIDAAIGKPTNLTTIDKTNLVAAINEVKEQTNSLDANKADLVNGKIPSIQLPNIEVPVQSVNSKTGAVVLTKTDIGLGNVDNSADSAKAVLSATKLATPRAINGVNFDGTAPITIADSTKAPTSHASTGTGYGIGTTANYGHCKVYNGLDAAAYADGIALSHNQGKVINDKFGTKEYLTWLNGWTSIAGEEPISIIKNGNLVSIKGRGKGGSNPAFIVPLRYRPSTLINSLIFQVYSDTEAYGRKTTINTDGSVSIASPSASTHCFDITYNL